MNTKSNIWFVVAVIFAVGTVSQAGLTFDMDSIFDGPGIPANSGPWVSVVIEDTAADTVSLKIGAPNLEDFEKVSQVYLNLDPVLNPADLDISLAGIVGEIDTPTVFQNPTMLTDYKADGSGIYDIFINFETDTAGAFNGGEEILYTITLPGLSSNSFDFLSDPSGSNGPFKVAAHIISLGDDLDSAWVTVPEPATMLLLGLGSVLLRKRK